MSPNKLALEMFPNFCVCCGFGLVKQNGKVNTKPFEVHHMDNAEQKNNNPSNLVILCGRCHRLHHLGFITKKDVKQKKYKMIKEYKKSFTSFQKYRKELADNDQKRWLQKKNWEGNWKEYTDKAKKRRQDKKKTKDKLNIISKIQNVLQVQNKLGQRCERKNGKTNTKIQKSQK